MYQIILELVDLDAHLSVFEAVRVDDSAVLFDFFLLLCDGALVALLLLLELNARLGQLSTHVVDGLGFARIVQRACCSTAHVT